MNWIEAFVQQCGKCYSFNDHRVIKCIQSVVSPHFQKKRGNPKGLPLHTIISRIVSLSGMLSVTACEIIFLKNDSLWLLGSLPKT
ncbi:MAG: hypothetical protein DRR19_14485 [Candidatus Parabeggiatoa sp. nov. 1]|nr:MAG: hypothetical protein DRR19_14485 [Gammaproteobacteria bacterium]